jgi:hypothetical protein
MAERCGRRDLNPHGPKGSRRSGTLPTGAWMNPRLVAYVGRNSGLIGSTKGTCHEKVLDRGSGRDIRRWGRLRPNGLRRKPVRQRPAISGLCGACRKRRRGTPRSCRKFSRLAVQRGRTRRDRGHRRSALQREVAVRRGLLPPTLNCRSGAGPCARLLTSTAGRRLLRRTRRERFRRRAAEDEEAPPTRRFLFGSRGGLRVCPRGLETRTKFVLVVLLFATSAIVSPPPSTGTRAKRAD